MKILIAHDDASSRETLEATLARWGHQVVVAPDGAAALQSLQKDSVLNLAILDTALTGMDGLQVCREARKRTEAPYTYFIFLVAKGREQDILEGVRAGADDFLLLPLNTDELMVRLRVAKRTLEMLDELQRANEAIRYQTTHDPMTGLWNRASTLDSVRRELARVQREGTPMGVILSEIDHFKHINETHGHMAGDAVLREAARRIRTTVRPYDTLGRFGGEEFLALVPGCDAQKALSQAERLRNCLSVDPMDISEWGKFAPSERGAITVTLSVGVAAGNKIKDAETLLRAAEAALDRAKKRGPNCVEVASETELA